MLYEEIIHLTKQKTPTIVGYDLFTNNYIIGEKARITGMDGKGQTAVFGFKPSFLEGDKEFSKEKNFWFSYVLENVIDPKKK